MQEVLRYIHDNPVKAKIVNDDKDYIYSSVYKYRYGTNEEIENLIDIIKYGDTSAGSCELLEV